MKYDWQRLDGESAVAFQAFATYRDLGLTRSINAVVEKLGKSVALLCRWSSQHNWVERVRKFDEHQEAIREQERQRLLVEEEKEFSRLRKQLIKDEIRLAGKLLKKAELIADMEAMPRVDEDGKVCFDPVKIAIRDSAALGKTGSEMMRRALNIPDEPVSVMATVTHEDHRVGISLPEPDKLAEDV